MSSRFVKEFNRLQKNLEKKTNGQALIKDYDEASMTTFILELAPSDGPYRHGKFLFQVQASEYYPDAPPDVVCITDIYHPNIDAELGAEHNICLNLFDEWSRAFGLEDCVQGLLFLLYRPNIGDPVSGYFNAGMDYDLFLDNVRKSLRGEAIDGNVFQVNYGWAEHLRRLQRIGGDAAGDSHLLSYEEASSSQPISEDDETTPRQNCRPVSSAQHQDFQPIGSEQQQSAQPISCEKQLALQPISSEEQQQISKPISSEEQQISKPISSEEQQVSQPVSSGDQIFQPISSEEQQVSQPISSEISWSCDEAAGADASSQPLGDSGRPDSPALSAGSIDELELFVEDELEGGGGGGGGGGPPRDFVFCRFRPAASDSASGTSPAPSSSSSSSSSPPPSSSSSRGSAGSNEYQSMPATLRVGRATVRVFASRRYAAAFCVRVNGRLVHPGAARLFLRSLLAVADAGLCGPVAAAEPLPLILAACLRCLLLPPLI